MSVKITVDTAAFDANLTKYIDTVKDKVVVSMAAAAAREFYHEMQARVPFKTGKLREAIYRKLLVDRSYEGHAEYRISWDRRIAPHGHLVELGFNQYFKKVLTKKGWRFAVRKEAFLTVKPKPSRKTRLAEFSKYYIPLDEPKRIAPRPFIRPTYDSAKGRAMDAARRVLVENLG